MSDFYSFYIQPGFNKNNHNVNGTIRRHQLSEGMEFYSFQFTCQRDFKLHFQGTKDTTIYSCVNLETKANLRLTCGDTDIVCPPFSSLLIPFTRSEKVAFEGVANKNYDFVLLRMDRAELDEDQLALLQWLEEEKRFLDPSNYERSLLPNLAVCEVARKLQKLKEISSENKFIARGYCNILFGLKLKEFTEEDQAASVNLSSYEIKQLEILTDQIKKDPQQQYSIKDICRQTGLSVSKLQLGFKEMHNTTVTIFIRNVRLEKAVELLRQTNMNVAEIVYTIGLTSRSYFCRVFKKRYRCSPKKYQQLHKIAQSSVS